MNRRILPIILLLALVASFFMGREISRQHRLKRNLALIQTGMKDGEVSKLLGRPPKIEYPCLGKNNSCSFDYIYPLSFERDWVISFDASNRVISQQEWNSR